MTVNLKDTKGGVGPPQPMGATMFTAHEASCIWPHPCADSSGRQEGLERPAVGPVSQTWSWLLQLLEMIREGVGRAGAGSAGGNSLSHQLSPQLSLTPVLSSVTKCLGEGTMGRPRE